MNTAKPCRGVSPSEVLRKRETPLRLINMANRTHNQSTSRNTQTMKYDPNIHHRRSIRLPGYDYSQVGAYFVTICAY
ncbi:MAG: hypothetical protein ACRC2S_03435 [Waterburya sp.]